MKNKVVLVLVDDDKDENPTVYSINDRGVVVIEDSEKDSLVHVVGNEDSVLRTSLSNTTASSSVPTRTSVEENSLKRKRDGVELNEQSLQVKKTKKPNTSNDSELNAFADSDANTTQSTATNTPLVWSTGNQCSTSHAPGSNDDNQNCSENKQQMASLSNNKNENSSAKTNTSKHDKVVKKDPGIACPVCQQIFTGHSKSSCLAKHYRQVHLLSCLRCKKCVISTRCPFCPPNQKEWKFRELSEHINSGHQEHFDGLSYICPRRCDKLLRTPQALIDHYVAKHERVVFPHYTCDLCEGIGKHVHFCEENSLAHYIKEHGSVLTKDVYEAFARSRHALIVARFNKDQLPSTLSEGRSPAALPSSSNSKLSLSWSSNDANVLTSVPNSQSSSNSKNYLLPCSSDMNNVSQTSSNKNKSPASSSRDKSVLPSISSTQSSSNSRDNSPACTSEKSNWSSTSSNKRKTPLSSSRNESMLPSISSTQSSSNGRNNSPACSSEKNNMLLTSSNKSKTPSSSSRDKNVLPSSNKNNVSTSNNDEKSGTSSIDIIVLTSSCDDRRKTQSSFKDKTDLSSTSNNSKNCKLLSSSSKDKNVLPSAYRRITRSFFSGKTDLSSATNSSYSQKSPLSSPKDKNALPLIANTQSSLNDKHSNVVSNSSNRSKSPTSSTKKHKPPSNTSNKKNVELSSHNLRSSHNREVSLSNDSVHLKTDRHRSSGEGIKVTIKNSLANATATKSTYISKGVDGSKEASTNSSNGVQQISSDSSATSTRNWLPIQTNDHHSHSSDVSNSTRQQGTNHNGLSTATSQSKVAAKGKDLTDRTVHRYIDATRILNDNSSLMGHTYRKSLTSESAARKNQSNDRVDKSSASLLLSDRSKTSCHSGNVVKESCSTSQAPNKRTHSHTSGAIERTISSPSSTSGKRKRDTSPGSLQGEKQSSRSVEKDTRGCHSTTDESHSCSTQYNSKDVQAYDSHKRLRTQSAPSTTSSLPQTSVATNSSRKVLSNLENSNNLPTDSLQNLSKFLHIIFVDLDNWGRFFSLPFPLSPTVFVWGFCGGNFMSKKTWSVHFRALVQEKRFFQHPRCGTSKNAADFALCVQAARLDLQLPVHIPFTILSGDRGFGELRNQLKSSARQIHLVDPHHEEQDMLHGMLASIGEK